MRLLSYEPVLIRLKQLGGEVKDLKGMECSLRFISMAIKKQIVSLQNNLSISLGISSPRGDIENDDNVGYMSELDRRAVKHRMACLQVIFLYALLAVIYVLHVEDRFFYTPRL
jgi:hypothetical protein